MNIPTYNIAKLLKLKRSGMDVWNIYAECIVMHLGVSSGLFDGFRKNMGNGYAQHNQLVPQYSGSYEELTSEELAKKIGADPFMVQGWCDAAYAFRILDYNEKTAKYSLSKSTRVVLELGMPLGLDSLYITATEFMNSFSQYGDIIRGKVKHTISPNAEAMIIKSAEKASRLILPCIVDELQNKLKEKRAKDKNAEFRVLDVGCGSGAYLDGVLSKMPEIHAEGIDLQATAIEMAKANLTRYKNVSLKVLNFFDLPSDEKKYDAVMFNSVLHYFKNTGECIKFIKKARDVLNPGGILLISEPILPSPKNRKELRKFPYGLMTVFDLRLRLGADTGRIYSSEELVESCEKAGMVLKDKVTTLFGGLQLIVTERKG